MFSLIFCYKLSIGEHSIVSRFVLFRIKKTIINLFFYHLSLREKKKTTQKQTTKLSKICMYFIELKNLFPKYL